MYVKCKRNKLLQPLIPPDQVIVNDGVTKGGNEPTVMTTWH